MKLGPNCAGKCCICACNTCLAGNGDDDFSPATYVNGFVKAAKKRRIDLEPLYRESSLVNFFADLAISE